MNYSQTSTLEGQRERCLDVGRNRDVKVLEKVIHQVRSGQAVRFDQRGQL